MHKRRIHSAPHGYTTLRDWRLGRTPAPRRRSMSNYAINLAFLEAYVRESGYALSPPPTGLDGAPLHAMGGPKRLLPQERLRGLPRPGHLPRLRRAAGNVCGGDRPPRGQAPMAKPWQLRLLPKRGDGEEHQNLRSTKRRAIEAPHTSQRYYKKTTKPQIHYQDNRQKVAKASTTTPVTFL